MEVPRGFTRCDECEGHGIDGSTFVAATHLTPSEAEPCPSCSGSGLVPTEKLREEAAGALWNEIRDNVSRHSEYWAVQQSADAVLRKVAEHLGGRE